jgi:hydroxyethylthiazole kinase
LKNRKISFGEIIRKSSPESGSRERTLAQALVLNLGTLTTDWIASLLKAGKKASELGIPIVLDPVGSGATSLRTNTALKVLEEIKISVIRGNASEILSLRYKNSKTKGVDSIHSVEEAAQSAQVMAGDLDTIIAITGASDFITNGERVIRVSNGHPLMGRVAGTGCAASVTIGAFLAVDDHPIRATATGLAFLGLAGEVAAENASAPGSFMIKMIDALYTITPETLKDGCKIVED